MHVSILILVGPVKIDSLDAVIPLHWVNVTKSGFLKDVCNNFLIYKHLQQL